MLVKETNIVRCRATHVDTIECSIAQYHSRFSRIDNIELVSKLRTRENQTRRTYLVSRSRPRGYPSLLSLCSDLHRGIKGLLVAVTVLGELSLVRAPNVVIDRDKQSRRVSHDLQLLAFALQPVPTLLI